MAAGLISEREFRNFAEKFINVSNAIHDDWEIRHIHDGKEELYLLKKESRLLKELEDKSEPMIADTKCDQLGCENLDEDDQSCAIADNVKTKIYVYEYHVIYSASYNVPVLYFNVHKSDGRLVSLEEIWRCVPSHYRDKLEVDKWSFLTQQEHPFLGRPFYQLHPCHTADLMKQVPGDSSQFERNYIISWLSSVGPVIGLNLSLEYGKMIQKGNS